MQKILAILIVIGMMLAPGFGSAADAPSGTPSAYLPESVYEFQPVVEGSEVAHGFTIENRGDAPLEIIDVKTGWGCTAASSARLIPPGREGRIEVKFNTKGYAGNKIRESVSVITNDPNQPRLEVALTGQVETFAKITPERVYFAGPSGKHLGVEIEIVPRKDLPFKITGIKARNGSFIAYEQTERCSDGKNRCVIRVENTRAETGHYTDALTIHTDSKIKPSFPIYISGTIQ